MASLKVFADMMSQPSRSVILLLKANKIPFKTTIIDIAKGNLLTLYSMTFVWLISNQSQYSILYRQVGSYGHAFMANIFLLSPLLIIFANRGDGGGALAPPALFHEV